MDFVIGGLAGAGATMFTNPMDVVKTRLQLQGELTARSETVRQYRNIFHSLVVIARTEGIMALQRGLAPAMMFGFTMNSIRLGIYRLAELQGWMTNKNGDTSLTRSVFWGATGGLVSGLITNPIMVVKTRIQAASHPSIAVGRQHKYDGVMHAFVTIFKKEGLKGYFAGVRAAAVRVTMGSGVQLSTFAATKQAILKEGFFHNWPVPLAFFSSLISGLAVAIVICPLDVTSTRLFNEAKRHLNSIGLSKYPPVVVSFVASVLCGIPLVLLETPLDVVGTRIMNQGPACTHEKLYSGVWDALRKTWQTEGTHGLFKGFGPLYWRIAPQTTLSLVFWDFLKEVFDPIRQV